MSSDALSDVLSAVRLTGLVFFDVTAKSPWVAEMPPAAQLANEVTPGAQQAIEYRVVTRGSCWISVSAGRSIFKFGGLTADSVFDPMGDAYCSQAPGRSRF